MGNYLEGYEQQIVAGAGLSVSAGAKKVVLHTTETGPGSLQNLINHWRTNWGAGLPHFIIEGSRVVQLLPLNVGAYTLENAAGGADTNRSGPAVQVEVVSYAANDWDDATYNAVGKWLADLVKAGHTFDIENTPRWYGANEGIILASYGSPIRMTAQQYIDFNGWCAHQHCPENAHWDCGRKNTDRIKSIYYAHIGGTAPAPLPSGEDFDMTEAELVAILTKTVGAWEQDTRRILSGSTIVRLDDQNGSLWTVTTDAGGKYRRYHITDPAQLGLLQKLDIAGDVKDYYIPATVWKDGDPAKGAISNPEYEAFKAIPEAGNPIITVDGNQKVDVAQISEAVTKAVLDQMAARLKN